MSGSITFNDDNTTVEVYDYSEARDLLAAHGRDIAVADGFKVNHKIRTFRLFAPGKVMTAPRGFTWEANVRHCTTSGLTTDENYLDKAQVDALVASLP